MDSVFQSLLLGGGNVSSGSIKDDKSSAAASASSTAASGPGGGNNGIIRPSRYATLIPREAMKLNNSAQVIMMQQQQQQDEEAGQEEKEESVAVYKLVNGELTLLDEDEYDVVVSDELQAKNNTDKDGKTNHDDDNKDDDMDVDSSTETDAVNDDTILYIVHPNRPRNNGGGAIQFSSARISPQTSAISNSAIQNDNNTIMMMEENEEELAAIKEASHTASTLARALAQRTDGFNELRPKYYDFMNADNTNNKGKNGKDQSSQQQQQQQASNKKGDKKSKLSTTAASSSSTVQTSKSGDKSKSATNGGKGTTSTTANSDATSTDKQSALSSTEQQRQLQYSQTQKLIASLNNNNHHQSSSNNIRDGDTPKTILQLTQMRMWQERHIDPSMQGMELENWEDDIDWEGAAGCDTDDDDNNNGGNTNHQEEKKEVGRDMDDGSYKPPTPEGGYPKRPRRMLLPQYEDPVELLYEPRNPRLEALDLISSVDWEGAASDTNDDDDDDNSVNVPLILQSSIAGKSVASLLAPCPTSRPLPFELHPNYQQRYDRESISEITSTADPGNKQHEALEKYKEQRQRKREQMAKDKQHRVTEVMSALSLSGTGRRITSSLMGPGGAERTGRPSRHALGSSSAHDAEYVEQLELVYNHTLVKPDLSLSEYRQFHRPRLPLAVVNPTCPWQFQTRVITENKRSSRGATAADGSTIVGSYHSMMSAGAKAQHKIRNEADLSPSIGDLVVLEYCEERPPLFMTKGHTCRIVNYYRGDRAHCPVSAGGGDRPLRKRHGDKAASAKGPTPDGPSNRAERPPRLVGPNQYSMKSAADLIGIQPKKKKSGADAASKEAKKESSIDILPEGVTEILHQKVHGPFIGEVEEGKTQTGLISNLFAAAMFRHDSEPTDFLMILGQMREASTIISGTSAPTNSSGGLGVILRALPANIYTVAQTEPRLKVFSPNTNDEKKFVNAMFAFQVAKNIERKEIHDGEGLTFDEIKDRLFANTTVPINQLRKHVKQVANFDRANKGIWSVKSIGEDDFPGVEGLGRKVSPEGVAAYESQCAAIHRLKDLGITELYTGTNMVANVAMVQTYLNGAAQAAMQRRLKMKKVLEVMRRQKSSQLVYYEKAFEKLDAEYKRVKRRQEIAKFIYEELQLSPWYLSGEFIDIHKRGIGTARMRLTGLGDPSGVGEAYNFIREMDSRSSSSLNRNTDGALNAQIKKITGTENDLRKLTMKQMASLLRSYGMKDKQISVLKRWDRVHVIRDLSTKAASDGMGDELGERFARGEKLRLSDQRENYKQRIQEIWRRQLAALGSDTVPSDQVAKVTKTPNNADAKEAEKETADASSDEEDADFAAMMEMEMENTGTANRLVANHLGGSSGMRSMGQEALSQEARELADFQRQQEEERAIKEGLGQVVTGGDLKAKKKFKVIRRKTTKTNPDGTQVVTFEFIVNKEKVESIMEKKKQKEENEKPHKKKKKKTDGDEDVDESRCVGHAMFEDEDNVRSRGRRSIKLSMKKETVSGRKGTGPKKASQNKLSSTVKHKRELVRQKRLKEKEEAEMYKSHVSGKGTSARKKRGSVRDRMPHVILSDRFESIRAKVELRPYAGPFFKPVSRTDFPTYYETIAWPIDLSTIREKNQKYEYKTADSFLAEFDLMRKNAVKFNGEHSPISAEAREIYEFVKSTIEQNRDEFNQMEQAVVDQLAGKKKTSKKKGTSTASSSAGTMTANVVLDGVQTQVNLGNNLTFGFGSDSDDSD